MTNHYDRYLIDELETLVDKYRRSKVDLRLIDEALSKRKPKNRNLALRDKIAELLKVEPQSNKQSSAQTTSTGHIGDDMDKTPAVEYPEGFMKEAFVDMRKKLLDISGSRSRLINLDQTRKGVVRFVDELPDQLARTLLDDKAMTVRACAPYAADAGATGYSAVANPCFHYFARYIPLRRVSLLGNRIRKSDCFLPPRFRRVKLW